MKQWYNGNLKPCIICNRIIDNEPHEAVGKDSKHINYAHRICIQNEMRGKGCK